MPVGRPVGLFVIGPGGSQCRPQLRTTASPTGTKERFWSRSGSPGSCGFVDALTIDQAIAELLGPGTCLEIGCGTGIYADRVRSLGRQPVGVEISAGTLRHARDRLATVQGDAVRLPFASNSVSAVIGLMVHTDTAGYPEVVAEAHLVLAPGGVFVHVGVHPCFCGGFADTRD